MRRLVAVVLILHGLAHAGAGMWWESAGVRWLHGFTWSVATLAFAIAGSGLLGLSYARRYWQTMLVLGVGASLLMLVPHAHPVAFVGIAIDLLLLAVWLRWRAALSTGGGNLTTFRRARPRLGHVVAVAALAYLAGTLVLRPWHTRWGTTAAERVLPLPGDELVPDARYRIDHAITIAASADSIWPWLAQLGQDRGGFYSYAWLENLIGAEVHNADSIVPAWQERHVGDLVRAVPAKWLGGRFGKDIGWRIARLEPGHAIVLEGWGAFVLVPVDAKTTRLIVRTRGDGRPTVGGSVLAPFGLLVFEPAHFIMQRRMLLGIKERAERRRATAEA